MKYSKFIFWSAINNSISVSTISHIVDTRIVFQSNWYEQFNYNMIYSSSLKWITEVCFHFHTHPFNTTIHGIFSAMIFQNASNSVNSIMVHVANLFLSNLIKLTHARLFSWPSEYIGHIICYLIWKCSDYDDYTFFSSLGHVIVITGIPYGNPKGWFQIKFTEAASKRQALHMSTRFEPHFVVVRTSMNENCE